MKQIIKYGGEVYKLLGYQGCFPDKTYKPSHFCIAEKVTDGYLIYHTMTREMLLMTDEEYQHLYLENWFGDCHNFRYLVRHWYLVEDSADETAMCETVKHILRNADRGNGLDKISHYTILTTTNCNARCPYCYEYGRRKRSMTAKVAMDVADYISRTAMPSISLSWFGGEPLVNHEVITIICQRLAMKKIPFTSTMVSNGYLFDQVDMNTMLNVWKLKTVQITLDGTEEMYNATKDYVYPDANGYQRVMENIGRLLAAGINASIRLNLSKDNVDEMKTLVDVIDGRFGGKGWKFGIYPHPLFEGYGDPPLEFTDEERDYVYERYIQLQDYLLEKGLTKQYNLTRTKYTNCMADNHKSVVIMPEGKMSICEHHTDDEFIGSIYDKIDMDVVNSWLERRRISDCKDCVLLPQCNKLKKCIAEKCTEHTRKYAEHLIRRAMCYEYERSVVRQ